MNIAPFWPDEVEMKRRRERPRYSGDSALRRFCNELIKTKAFETQEPKWKAIVIDIEADPGVGRTRNRGTEVVRVNDTIVTVPPDAG